MVLLDSKLNESWLCGLTAEVANKGCMDRSTARRLRHVIGVTWLCQKEAENSVDSSFQSQDFHGQVESEAVGVLWKA